MKYSYFRWILTCALALCLVQPAAAQAHLCDTTPIVTATADQSFGIGFCHTLKNLNGDPVTLTQVRLIVDGVERFKGPLSPQGGPSAAGEYYFETPRTTQLPAGAHVAQIFVANAAGDSAVATLSLTITASTSRPATPLRLRIVSAN